MPPVRNLTQDAAPATSHAAPSHANHAAPAEIQKTNPAKGGAIAVPSFLSALPAKVAGIDELPQTGTGPYLGIANNRSNKWTALKVAGFVEGDMYVTFLDGFKRVMPCKFFLLCADLFKSSMDSLGNITAATRDMANRDLAEHVCAVMLIEVEGKLRPVVADFMRAASNGPIAAVRAAQAAAEPGWAEQSPAHAAAAGFQIPMGRVFFVMDTTIKTAKTSGNRYCQTSVQAFPATAAEMKAFAAAVQDADTVEAINAAKESFDAKVRYLESRCK